jgi:pimeloyl-ACP methyl ester carboxylesterase
MITVPLHGARVLPVALCLLISACATPSATSPSQSESESRAPQTSAAPPLAVSAAPAFYHPSADAVANAAPGEIIRAVEIRAPSGMRAWTVLYGSIGLDGQPVAVSGIILAPAGAPSARGYPVVAWAHGTTGIADRCAPSRSGVAGVPMEAVVAAGYVVTATDYEGLGTDGTHPYLIGVSEGRSVLDSIRAAKNLPEAHAADETVVMGLSQGGHSALWAAQLAPTYAPELDLRGALAASPPADMSSLLDWTVHSAAAGQIYTAMAPMLLFGVWSETYGLPLPFLTDRGRRIAATVASGCDSGLEADPYASNPTLDAQWSRRLVENSPGAARTDVPILVVAPSDDQLVSYESQVAGVVAMCAIGDTVELRTVSGGHDAFFFSAAGLQAAQDWIAARIAGEPATSTCAPV